MKQLAGLIALILISAVSCSKDELHSEFEKSYEYWKDFKKTNNNSYFYTTTTYSWAGFRTETTLVIKNRVVTDRLFKMYTINGSNGVKTLTTSWTEDHTSLNSHQQGAETLTMDQIYDKAKDVWLKVNKEKNTVYFEEKNNGIISKCGYVPKDCADDCFFGIVISAVKPLVREKYVE